MYSQESRLDCHVYILPRKGRHCLQFSLSYVVACVVTDRSIQRVGRQAQKTQNFCFFNCAKKLSSFRSCIVYNSLGILTVHIGSYDTTLVMCI